MPVEKSIAAGKPAKASTSGDQLSRKEFLKNRERLAILMDEQIPQRISEAARLANEIL
jgi:hypothetical protein